MRSHMQSWKYVGVAALTRVKLLHCADLHLDAPFTSLSDSTAAETRRYEIKLAFRKIIAAVKEEAADLLLVAGDLFEHGYVGKSTIQMLSDEFERLGDTQVLIIPGNHDPFVPDSYYSTFTWPVNVHILTAPEQKLDLASSCVSIYGGIPKIGPDRSRINILLLHGTVDMNPDGRAYNPYTSVELDALGMDYVALGHFHNCISGAGSQGRIFNPGSPEPLGFDEEGSHGVFIVEIEKSEGVSLVNPRFMSINSRAYRNAAVKLNECATDEQAAEKAVEAFEAGCADDLYRITFQGTTAAGFRLNRNRAAGYLKDRAFYLKVKDDTFPAYDLAGIRNEPGLRGVFTDKMLAKAELAANEEARLLIMQALYYGLEAIDRGEIHL